MGRAAIERYLQSVWYGDQRPPLALRALQPLYYTLASHRRPTATGIEVFGVPVVVVGNITAGGVGKTPLVIALVQRLQNSGRMPAVVSRGYGRDSGELRQVQANDTVQDVGDEPLLIRATTGAPVYVAQDRAKAARQAVDDGADIIISDDGLQHAGLPRDFEICIIDERRRYGNGKLIPAGPLRQSLRRLDDVDLVLVRGQSATADLRFVPTGWSPVGKANGRSQALDAISGSVEAFAGIGNPQAFFDQLTALGLDVKPHARPDHHQYTRTDFLNLQHDTIVMTAKDAVKCHEFELANAYSLDIALASLPSTLVEALQAQGLIA